MKRSRRAALLLVACSTASSYGFAEPSETDRSLAQSLFEQARQLMDAGDLAEACPKFQESQRLDPGGGTLMNLALCHERQGKIATAWADFKAALSAARRDQRPDRAEAMEQKIAELEPKLPWLTVNVTAAAEGEQIAIDGAAFGRAAWGAPVAIDPGSHEIQAIAPGRKPWTTRLTIAIADKRELEIPELQQAPAAETPAAAPPPARAAPAPAESVPATSSDGAESKSGSGALGWIIGGAGVAALGVGSYFGVRTFQKRDQANAGCPSDTTCTKEGARANEDAYTAAWISNIGIGVGLVGIGVGAYLLLSAGSDAPAPRSARHSPALTLDARSRSGGGELMVGGTF